MFKKKRGIIILSIFFLSVFLIFYKSQETKRDDLEKGFTYLDELTDAEQENYQSFLETKNSDSLIFSPEKTLLVYLHAVSHGDIEAIHALTQTTESLDEFSARYQGSEQSYQDMESVMTYRYYDYAEIFEDENTDDTNVNVEIAISQAANKWVTFYHLIKDGDNWKVNLANI